MAYPCYPNAFNVLSSLFKATNVLSVNASNELCALTEKFEWFFMFHSMFHYPKTVLSAFFNDSEWLILVIQRLGLAYICYKNSRWFYLHYPKALNILYVVSKSLQLFIHFIQSLEKIYPGYPEARKCYPEI